MDGDLTADQVDRIYHLFAESGITYLSVGEHASLRAYHDTILALQVDGSWTIGPASEGAGESEIG